MVISLAGWSLHRRFLRTEAPLKLLDYPATARSEFGIDKVELNSPFFEYADAENQAGSNFRRGYLAELRRRAQDAGVACVGVAVDDHGDLSSLDEAQRRQAVENHRKWFDACCELGCAAFRANSGGQVDVITHEHEARCADSYRQLAEWGTQQGVTVLMENHWGLSSDPERMLGVHRAVNSPRFALLADFRNFPPGIDVYAALARIAPHAGFVHAKFLNFNQAGEDPDFDTGRVMGIFKAAGYRGGFGIEFEGEGDDSDGVRRSLVLLNRYAYV